MQNRLKELRTEKGWTQEELGKRAGVSRQAVNALETEKHDPSLDLAYRIAALFGKPAEGVFANPYRAAQSQPDDDCRKIAKTVDIIEEVP
jgi:putative transcriptional regulator